MPIDPQLASAYVKNPTFQAQGPQQQLALFRSFLARNVEGYKDQLDELQQVSLAKEGIEAHGDDLQLQ